MKFGKRLSNQIEETLPEWRDKFLSYKDLKKRLKLIEPRPQRCEERRAEKRRRVEDGGGEAEAITEEEASFVRLLEDELEKFNAFFVEKEEYIIRLKELRDRVERFKSRTNEMSAIRREIVDFHGEMVLLENYSALNYTGLVKILKKYDKRTGALLRLPFIQKVLQEPFFTTDLLFKLVEECEKMLDQMFPARGVDDDDRNEPLTSSAAENGGQAKATKDLAELEHMKSMYMKSTLSALRALIEIRSGSSTVSAFSLPPLQSSLLEGSWNTSASAITVLEQAAQSETIR